MIRVSAVKYLNSKPFIYGLKQSSIINEIDLQLDIPSVCAEKLLSGKVDIGLVPTAVLPEMPEYYVISDYGIGSVGKVGSVILVSNKPIEQVEEVLLDYQSRTSVVLAELLIHKSLKLNPVFTNGINDFESILKSSPAKAAVVIGDRALRCQNKYDFVYDLSEEWGKFTLLPFVFAQWVSRTRLPDEFVARFKKALKFGVENRSDIIADEEKNYPDVDVKDYLMNKISYNLDDKKQMGLNLFLSYVEAHFEKNVIKIV